MAHPLRYLILTLLLLGLAFTAHAQNPPPVQHVRFTVFCTQPATGLAFAPGTDAAAQPLVFYPTARSPRYEYRGAMPLQIVEAGTAAVVAEAAVPASIVDALLILVPIDPAPVTGPRYRVFILDDGAARQASGTLAIINFSGLQLSGTFEGRPIALAEGLNPVRPLGRSARLALRTAFRGRSYQAYAGMLDLEKNERALLLLLPPFDKGSLEVQSRLLTDSPPAQLRR